LRKRSLRPSGCKEPLAPTEATHWRRRPAMIIYRT
jgi:hypothetical protein